MNGLRKIIAIVGPTASGKSSLAVKLAQEFGGEIVSADSRQIYRELDIGTAKPSAEERSIVVHHLIDIVNPDQKYSLALFLQDANKIIDEIYSRSKLPIIVGGTGQYIWGLLEGWKVPSVHPNTQMRLQLEQRAKIEGADLLHQELKTINPVAASKINSQNVRRVIRALEIHYSSGKDYLDKPVRENPNFDSFIVGLTLERDVLYEKINKRVDYMMDRGWLKEIEQLIRNGYSPDLPSISSLGYKELYAHLSDTIPLTEAVNKIKQRTRRFSRQQYAWFKPIDPRINWVQVDANTVKSSTAHTIRFLNNTKPNVELNS